MFSGENVVYDSTFINNEAGGFVNVHNAPKSTAFKELAKNAAPGALHNSSECGDISKCSPGTRAVVLHLMITWAITATYAFPIRWLEGPAGAGKTAIMRTFADMLVQGGLLLASFFFFRSNSDRNDARYLIPTIAYQLCINIPSIRPHVEQAIDLNPLIFTSSISAQIYTLIVEPLLRLFYNPNSTTITPFPRVILIDGLDECQGQHKQTEILKTVCHMVRASPIPIAIVVASRPEPQIRTAFKSHPLDETHAPISLANNFDPDKDIRTYYLLEFERLRKNHPMSRYLSNLWPTADLIDQLVKRASGQFIYASTVIKFISSLRHNPSDRLKIILGLAKCGLSKPFQQLDLVYTTIFHDVDHEDLPHLLRLLGVLLSVITPSSSTGYAHQSPAFLEKLLGFQQGEVRRLLLDLESLLTVKEDIHDIHIFHKSFSEFIFDKSRAGHLFVDKGLACEGIVRLCIKRAFGRYDRDMLEYILDQFPICIRTATATEDLHHDIFSLNMEELSNLAFTGSPEESSRWCTTYGLRILTPMFLNAFQHSKFQNARNLYAFHLASSQSLIIRKLLLCAEDEILLAQWVLMSKAADAFAARATPYLKVWDSNFEPAIVRTQEGPGSYPFYYIERYEKPFLNLISNLLETAKGPMVLQAVQIRYTSLSVRFLQDLFNKPRCSMKGISKEHECLHWFARKYIEATCQRQNKFWKYFNDMIGYLLENSTVHGDLTDIVKQVPTYQKMTNSEIARAIDLYLGSPLPPSFDRYLERARQQEENVTQVGEDHVELRFTEQVFLSPSIYAPLLPLHSTTLDQEVAQGYENKDLENDVADPLAEGISSRARQMRWEELGVELGRFAG